MTKLALVEVFRELIIHSPWLGHRLVNTLVVTCVEPQELDKLSERATRSILRFRLRKGAKQPAHLLMPTRVAPILVLLITVRQKLVADTARFTLLIHLPLLTAKRK